VDDIDKLTKSQQDVLKTVTTQKHIKLERKGVDSTKEKCFFDTITTSNNPDDFWISKQDRRNEIIEVSDVRKQNSENKGFWDEFYNGLEDLDVMKAIYDHFANFKIELDIRNKTCRFDQKCLNKRISDSLPSSIDFIRNMFENVDFLKWKPMEYHVFSSGHIWIAPSYLYQVFGEYLSSIGSRLKPLQKKFVSTLDKLGIKVVRKRCKELFKARFRCLELSPQIIQIALQEEYGDVEILQNGFSEMVLDLRKREKESMKLMTNKLFPESGLLN